jgi:hypothetical protein
LSSPHFTPAEHLYLGDKKRQNQYGGKSIRNRECQPCAVKLPVVRQYEHQRKQEQSRPGYCRDECLSSLANRLKYDRADDDEAYQIRRKEDVPGSMSGATIAILMTLNALS